MKGYGDNMEKALTDKVGARGQVRRKASSAKNRANKRHKKKAVRQEHKKECTV